MYDARRELLTSFIIFIVSVLIGVISAANDPNFVRLILGNGYVENEQDKKFSAKKVINKEKAHQLIAKFDTTEKKSEKK